MYRRVTNQLSHSSTVSNVNKNVHFSRQWGTNIIKKEPSYEFEHYKILYM